MLKPDAVTSASRNDGGEPIESAAIASRDAILEKTFARAIEKIEQWPSPSSSYRLQLNPGFTFEQAAEIVSYLQSLGVSTIYASPVLQPNRGSMHGYDVVDHSKVNPELGGREGLERLSEVLSARGMSLIVDIVPNHMGIGPENRWWRDVLENGPSSRHAGFFDINWSPIKPELHDKVLVPVLGEQYGEVLESGNLRVERDGGGLTLRYYDHTFPIHPRSYAKVFGPNLDDFSATLGKDSRAFQELLSICTACESLPPSNVEEPKSRDTLLREKEVVKRRLAELIEESPEIVGPIERSVSKINGRAGEAESFDELHELLEEQSYRLAYWRVAGDQINYRRFFDINTLAAIRMESSEVFDESHALILDLIGDERVSALRIDHPDGLSRPKEYFARLQEEFFVRAAKHAHAAEAGPDSLPFEAIESGLRERYRAEIAETGGKLSRALPVYAEKILGGGERIPESWAVSGTTGYKFLNTVNGVFVDSANEAKIDTIYERFVGRPQPAFPDLLYETKKLILNTAMASQVNNLAAELGQIAEMNRRYRDFTTDVLRSAIVEYVACFPVYRSYVDETGPDGDDRAYIRQAIDEAKRRSPAMNASVFDCLERIVTMEKGATDEEDALRLGVAMEVQQLTSPVMAKSMEDTAFYLYVRLASLNEVGGEPQHFGVDLETFHRENEERSREYPGEMNTTSTHDTKRGEDVRARIDVLSELPDLWDATLQDLTRLAERHKTQVAGRSAPDKNETYLFYQTLLGTLPFGGLEPGGVDDYTARLEQYMLKAVKEAKLNTSWVNPNPQWEEALSSFVRGVIADPEMMEALAPLKDVVDRAGIYNSLSQLQIKMAAPGFLDIYQGCEQWNFSLVDPDNRRSVDFGSLRESLDDLRTRFEGGSADRDELLDELTEDASTGRIKQFMTWRGLSLRSSKPELFATGGYEALDASGPNGSHVVAFARTSEGDAVVSLSTRLMAGFLASGDNPWTTERVALPEIARGASFRNVYTGTVFETEEVDGRPTLLLGKIFSDFPAALLERV